MRCSSSPTRLLSAALDWRGWHSFWVSASLALVAALLGVGIVLWATVRWGPGANSDGLTYLLMARSLSAGLGYGYPLPGGGFKPMTHFPPGYPAAIAALLPLAHGDEAQAALWVNGLSLALLILLAAWRMYRVTQHAFPSGGLAAWLAIGYGLHRIYPYVFSEALFIPLVFLLAAVLEGWQERPTAARALLVGLSLAALTYVRWIGFAAFAWVALDTLWAWRHQLRQWQPWGRLALALGSGALLVGLWLLRNERVAGSATNRPLRWHPPTWEKARQAAATWQGWVEQLVYKLGGRPDLWAWALFVLGGVVVLWAWRAAAREKKPPQTALVALYRRWLLFIGVYCGLLLVSLTLVDAATPLDYRLLSPLFPSLSLLLAAAVWQIIRRIPWAVALSTLLWLAALWWGLKFDKWALMPLHLHGDWLRKARWQRADIWPAVRALPPDAIIVTNEYQETMYYTHRAAYALPHPIVRHNRVYIYDAVSATYQATPYTSLDEWSAHLAQAYRGKCTAVVYVSILEKETHSLPLHLALSHSLTTVYRAKTGVIFAPAGSVECLTAALPAPH